MKTQSLALPVFPPGPKLRFPWWQIRNFSTGVPNFLADIAREYGDMARFSVGGQAYYLLNHPNYIQDLFVLHRENLVGQAPFVTRSLFKLSLFGDVSSKNNIPHIEPNEVSWEIIKKAVQERSENWHRQKSIELQTELRQITKSISKNDGIAGTLTWAIYLLLEHPSTLLQVENELDAVLGERNAKKVEAKSFVFIRMVLVETLRLYPQVWLISQRVMKDIRIGRYTIPSGAIVLVSQWVMHHDLRYYPLPFSFDPMRWAENAQTQRSQTVYFPFQSGVSPKKENEASRWQIQILILVALLQNWRFHLVTEQKITPDFSAHLRPREEIWVRAKAR